MAWKKRDASDSIRAVVERNTGLSEKSILSPPQNPFLEHLDAAVLVIQGAISKEQPISIMGDYDADGITASAIMYLALKEAGAKQVQVRLPKRFSEGYGLSEIALDEFIPGLLITVDNGITAVKQVEKARSLGFTVLVTDHHLPAEDGILPIADCILDPNIPGDKSEFHGYCGAGIAFRIAKNLLGESHPSIRYLSALAAIGTVADVMDVLFDNRNIVKQGLDYMNSDACCGGIRALMDRFETFYLSTDDIGFRIAPAINAAGRMDDNGAHLAWLTLVESDPTKAAEYAEKLFNMNESRKEAVKDGMNKCHEIIAEECLYGDSPLVVAGDFHEGIVGILAGRLVEEYNVPAIVLSKTPTGIYKGSGRTYGDIHLKNLIDSAKDLLVSYGGHAGACGLSVEEDNIEPLKDRLSDNIPDKVEVVLEKNVYDLEVPADKLLDFLPEYERFSPYGHGNPKPVLKITDFCLSPRYGKFSSRLGDGSSVKLFGAEFDAVGFGLTERYESQGEPRIVDLFGTLGKNSFMGRITNQIETLDVETADCPFSETSLMGLLKERMKTI